MKRNNGVMERVWAIYCDFIHAVSNTQNSLAQGYDRSIILVLTGSFGKLISRRIFFFVQRVV